MASSDAAERLAVALKFSECLPAFLRELTAQARMSDDASVAQVLAEPIRHATDGRSQR